MTNIDIDKTAIEIERARTQKLSGVNPIIRSVPIHRVLCGAAEKFGSSKGDAADYQLSEPTKQIDYFLSHSWRASRWDKFFTLWMYFRLPAATLGSVIFAVIAFILTMTGVLPPMHPSVANRFPDLQEGGTPCSIWGMLFSLVGFFAGAAVQGVAERYQLLHSKGSFLDKLCIHQTDDKLKQEGIRSLGLFLRQSHEMLILWSPEYFSRLWCCFEVAAYGQAHREKTHDLKLDVILLPVQMGPVMYVYFW